VQARPPAADHTACVTAKGCSERSEIEPRIFRMAQMNGTLALAGRIVPKKTRFRYSGT